MYGKSQILDTDNEWYNEINPNFFYEKNLENIILSKMSIVFPKYIGIPFALTINTPEGEASKPDLALIRDDYKEWYIIEVELSTHSWEGHVEKQVRVFTNGIYPSKEVAGYINSKKKILDIDKLKIMIDESRPKVMVIVNEKMPGWEKKIKKYKALLSIFQIYKGPNGFDVYRVGGETPLIVKDKSHCEFIKGSPNILEVFEPAFIREADKSEIKAFYMGKLTRWKKLEDGSKVFLIPIGDNLLPIDKKYILLQSDSDEYYIRIG